MRRPDLSKPRPGALLPLVLALCYLAQPAFAADGRLLMGVLPADVQYVVAVDMVKVRRSKVFKDYMRSVKKDARRAAELKEFTRRVGFDMATDLETLVIGGRFADRNQKDLVIIAQGNLSKKRLKAAIQREEKVIDRKYAGITYFVGRTQSVATLDGTAVLATEKRLLGVLDRLRAKAPLARVKHPTLDRLAGRVAASAESWLVADVPEKLRTGFRGPAAAMAAAREVLGTLKLGSNVDLKLTGICPDEGTAQGLNQLFQLLLIELTRKPEVTKTGLGLLVRKTKTAARGRDVEATLTMTPMEIENLIEELARAAARNRARPSLGRPKMSPKASAGGKGAPPGKKKKKKKKR